MLVRRAATWVSTVLVAIVVAFTMPVSQLRTVSTIASCCCPDPERCNCPHPKPDSEHQPSMRACHTTEQVMIAPQLPTFSVAVRAIVVAPMVAVAVVEHEILSPHPAPPPARPDAPS